MASTPQKKAGDKQWNWQTTLLLLVVAAGIVASVARYILTGNDIPTGVITLLSFFGGAVLGVQRLSNHLHETSVRKRKGDPDDA